MYVQDYDELMPPAFPQIPPINGGDVNRMPYDMQILPYIKNVQIFTCPSDGLARPSFNDSWDGTYRVRDSKKRSYGIVGLIDTKQGGPNDVNTGVVSDWEKPGASLAEMDTPAETIALVESWSPNSNNGSASDSTVASPWGSLFTGCDTYKLPGRKPVSADLIDGPPTARCSPPYNSTGKNNQPARGHMDSGNYVFMDSHAKVQRWAQVRGNDFRLFKRQKPTVNFSP